MELECTARQEFTSAHTNVLQPRFERVIICDLFRLLAALANPATAAPITTCGNVHSQQ